MHVIDLDQVVDDSPVTGHGQPIFLKTAGQVFTPRLVTLESGLRYVRLEPTDDEPTTDFLDSIQLGAGWILGDVKYREQRTWSQVYKNLHKARPQVQIVVTLEHPDGMVRVEYQHLYGAKTGITICQHNGTTTVTRFESGERVPCHANDPEKMVAVQQSLCNIMQAAERQYYTPIPELLKPQ